MAALVIVAYNGIQQRARNISRIASAKELQKLLDAYVAQEGKYPSTSQGCVGLGYTDWNGDGSLDCGVSSGTSHPLTALTNELQKVTAVPKVDTTSIPGGGYTWSGYIYQPNQTINSQTGRSILIYYLEGLNQKCGVPEILSNVSGGYATNGAVNTNYAFGVTFCYLAINEP